MYTLKSSSYCRYIKMDLIFSSSNFYYHIFIIYIIYFNFNFYHYIYSNAVRMLLKSFFKCDFLIKIGINNCLYIDINNI